MSRDRSPLEQQQLAVLPAVQLAGLLAELVVAPLAMDILAVPPPSSLALQALKLAEPELGLLLRA